MTSNISQNLHPEDVKALVRKAGGSFKTLSERTGLGRSSFSHAVRRCVPSANRAISDFLNRPIHTLWPEWFDKDGKRRLLSHSNSSRVISKRTSKKGEAA